MLLPPPVSPLQVTAPCGRTLPYSGSLRKAKQACMRLLYNVSRRMSFDARNPRNLALLALVGLGCLPAISCKKASTAGYDRAEVRPATEAIAEADKFYAERTDLVKVKQGIVSLRQAQAGDSGNYEIAWRLAKFNYYLGAH